MREIIFRGRNENSTWIYGSLLVDKDTFDKNAFIYYICDIDGYSTEIVNTKTIGQFTGLTDKNGTKIFEGDILKGLYANGNAEVEMINGSWVGYAGKGWTDIGYVVDRVELIGNVYDNLELLQD